MSIEELAQRSQILFRKPQTEADIRRLFRYLAEVMPSHVSYKLKVSVDVGDQQQGAPVNRTTSLDFTGQISTNNPYSFAGFRSYRDTLAQERTKISGLRFETAGKDSLREARPEELVLWDRTRQAIQNYFS